MNAAVEQINPLDDTARIRQHIAMEHELSLEEAKEVPLCDMSETELTIVILHDPDVNERRAALRLLKLELFLRVENRMFESLGELKKEGVRA